MERGRAKPGWSVEDQARWRAAAELLEAGQYEQLAHLLHEAQRASEQTEDPVLASILAAATRICLACKECRADADWHQSACDQADERERAFRRQLRTFLDLARARQRPAGKRKREEPRRAPAAETGPSWRQPGLLERLGLGRRIDALLRRLPRPRPSDRQAPALSAAEEAQKPEAEALPEASADEVAPPRAATVLRKEGQAPPSLVVYCLGPFRVYQDEQPVEVWPSSKGKSIFKYLLTHRQRPVPKEVLMELFWPGAYPEAARNSLNVAIYGLRQALRQVHPSFSHVVFQDDCYLLSPELQIWMDCEAFADYLTSGQALEQKGDLVEAMRQYRAAEALYRGEFLEEDRYEDWPMPLRQSLQDDYLNLLEYLSRHYFAEEDYAACSTLCDKMLTVEPCCEEAHGRLMRCYSREGQPYLALRQYHLCVESLKEELGTAPTQATTTLYEAIRGGELP